MALIQKYSFIDTPTGNFTIVAPLKHGSRWLSSTPASMEEISGGYTDDWINELKLSLFENKESQFQTSKIKVKNYKKEIIVDKPIYFIYRDPYEWFVSSVRTAAMVYKTQFHLDKSKGGTWDGTLENIDVLMTNNYHYKFNYWRVVYSMIKDYDKSEIELVSLDDLSYFMRVRLLYNFPYQKEAYTFSSTYPLKTVLGITNIDIIEECKKCNPKLWDNFMLQIKEETMALDLLIEKFKWER